MTIWKYQLDVANLQVIDIPSKHQILSAQFQDGVLCVWALVDPGSKEVQKMVRVVGTGHPFEDHKPYYYVGTAQMGQFVWHVFVEK